MEAFRVFGGLGLGVVGFRVLGPGVVGFWGFRTWACGVLGCTSTRIPALHQEYQPFAGKVRRSRRLQGIAGR